MAKLFNFARMTTATTGTGTITLGSAAFGYITFAAAGVADGDIVAYGIMDGANSECGTGTYTASGTTLTRNVTTSTNSNAAISLSGNAQVYILARADDLIRAPIHPGGRLTLTSATPVLTSTVSAATSIIYTPYQGSIVHLFDGKSWQPYTFAEMSQAFSDTTKSPAAGVASGVYDMFVWNDSGTLRCTRGPAWTNTTTRGYTLTLQDGHYLNPSAITNGPAANRGLYVGTIILDGSAATCSFSFGASGNPATVAAFGVWNRYNKITFNVGINYTNTSSWTYNSQTWRVPNNVNGLQMSFICGLQEDTLHAQYAAYGVNDSTVSNSQPAIGIQEDSTSPSANCLLATTPALSTTGFSLSQEIVTTCIQWQKVGLHKFAAIEKAVQASTTVSFNTLGAGLSTFLATFTG